MGFELWFSPNTKAHFMSKRVRIETLQGLFRYTAKVYSTLKIEMK